MEKKKIYVGMFNEKLDKIGEKQKRGRREKKPSSLL